MNEITLLREAGPEPPALTPAACSVARAALLAEIDGPVRRRRAPSRRSRLKIGAAVLAVSAVASAAAVVLTTDPIPGITPTPQQDDAAGQRIELVDFDLPVVPLTLPAPPPGTTGPVFGGDGEVDSRCPTPPRATATTAST